MVKKVFQESRAISPRAIIIDVRVFLDLCEFVTLFMSFRGFEFVDMTVFG